MPSIFPLNPMLSAKYVSIFDLRLTAKERQNTVNSLIFLCVSVMPIVFLILIDTCIHDVNSYFAHKTSVTLNLAPTHIVSYEVEGDGFMASNYRYLFNMLDSSNTEESTFSNVACLPHPVRPNKTAHSQILTSILILAALACLQSYIKRWRSILAGFVYPERDQERAIWLYNHLTMLNSRMEMKLPRNKKRGDNTCLKHLSTLVYHVFNFGYYVLMNLMCCFCFGIIQRGSLRQVYHKIKFKLILVWLKSRRAKCLFCLKCGDLVASAEDRDDFIPCRTLKCRGFYCAECCIRLVDYECRLCKAPLIEDRLADGENDFFPEKDSSDEEAKLN